MLGKGKLKAYTTCYFYNKNDFLIILKNTKFITKYRASYALPILPPKEGMVFFIGPCLLGILLDTLTTLRGEG
jgi:hypothetical protein